MSAVSRVLLKDLYSNFNVFKTLGKELRCLSTEVSVKQSEEVNENNEKDLEKTSNEGPVVPSKYRFIYPEFLPDPSPFHRNYLREKLERMDMMARRTVVDLPEFYVGSILAVTYSEPHAPGKLNKFVGICIQRTGCGLRASFLLRNVIDHQGVEILFNLYDPAIQKIDCLRLEKRLDDELLYLRDAPDEYSTFPLDMEMEYLPEGSTVPLNDVKVPLKPQPWYLKWENFNLKGVQEGAFDVISDKRKRKHKEFHVKPWEKYDLMRIYRETIPEEEQQEIFSEVYMKLHALEASRKKEKRQRAFVRPTKRG